MEPTLILSPAAAALAGILLISVVAIESGGVYLLALSRERLPATPFQRTFARAGHAHAGVLVSLGLITAILTDATRLDGMWAWVARTGVPVAAILMPAGFFLSSMGRDVASPNRLVALVYAGAISLAIGVVTLGIGLLLV
jgi:hypothetical protein